MTVAIPLIPPAIKCFALSFIQFKKLFCCLPALCRKFQPSRKHSDYVDVFSIDKKGNLPVSKSIFNGEVAYLGHLKNSCPIRAFDL